MSPVNGPKSPAKAPLAEQLREVARREDARAGEEAEAIDALAGPLDDAFTDRLVAAAETARDGKPARAATAKVIPLRRVAWIAPPILAAAAALFLLMRAPGEDGGLPSYALHVEGADQVHRGDPPPDEGRLSLTSGGRVQIVARPRTPAAGPLSARAYIVRGDEARAVAGEVKVSPSGAAQLDGSVDALFGDARGDYQLVVFVGREDAVPATPEAAARALREGSQARAAVRSLTLRAAPP